MADPDRVPSYGAADNPPVDHSDSESEQHSTASTYLDPQSNAGLSIDHDGGVMGNPYMGSDEASIRRLSFMDLSSDFIRPPPGADPAVLQYTSVQPPPVESRVVYSTVAGLLFIGPLQYSTPYPVFDSAEDKCECLLCQIYGPDIIEEAASAASPSSDDGIPLPLSEQSPILDLGESFRPVGSVGNVVNLSRNSLPLLDLGESFRPVGSVSGAVNLSRNGLPLLDLGESFRPVGGSIVNSAGNLSRNSLDLLGHSSIIPPAMQPAGPRTLELPDVARLSLLDSPGRSATFGLENRDTEWNNGDGRGSIFTIDASPDVVFLTFDKGQQVVKINRALLCAHSGHFLRVFGACDPSSKVHKSYRLRGTFPYAIEALSDFLTKGEYSLYPDLIDEYPYFTMMDLHVHAYLVANKYDVPILASYACDEYVRIATQSLSWSYSYSDIPVDWQGRIQMIMEDTEKEYLPPMLQPDDDEPEDGVDDRKEESRPTPIHPSAMPSLTIAHHPNRISPRTEYDRFMDSVVLLWKNTPDGKDMMRQAAIGLVKKYIVNLTEYRFFNVMLQQLDGFLPDLQESLKDDGLELHVRKMKTGDRRVLQFGTSWGRVPISREAKEAYKYKKSKPIIELEQEIAKDKAEFQMQLYIIGEKKMSAEEEAKYGGLRNAINNKKKLAKEKWLAFEEAVATWEAEHVESTSATFPSVHLPAETEQLVAASPFDD